MSQEGAILSVRVRCDAARGGGREKGCMRLYFGVSTLYPSISCGRGSVAGGRAEVGETGMHARAYPYVCMPLSVFGCPCVYVCP